MVSEQARADFVAKLESDVRRTLGAAHVSAVRAYVEKVAELGRDDFDDKVAEDVQQFFMDTHVHTTWPPCPSHPHHPLWYEKGAWRCASDASIVIALGTLRAGTS